MDDNLSQPSFEPTKVKPDQSDAPNDPQSDDEVEEGEDGQVDWTKLMPSHHHHSVTIPKRGDKQFEPTGQGESSLAKETNLQQKVLERAREAMFTTLRAERTISSKAISYAVWHPEIARAEVTLARGNHFSSVGHSTLRPASEFSQAPEEENEEEEIAPESTEKLRRRLELLPEEALYLIERGSLECFKAYEGSNVDASPMSVQQAYAEMLGTENLDMDRYQVYTYLRRLGYVVMRTIPPTEAYPDAAPYPKASKITLTSSQPLTAPFFTSLKALFSYWNPAFDWWKPLHLSRWGSHDKSYYHIYQKLRDLIPSGFQSAKHNEGRLGPLPPLPPVSAATPYKPFWNLYKPVTPFRKTAPPPPDYQVVVVNAQTTPMPSLPELVQLFDLSPEQPPPKRKQRIQNTPINSRPVIAPPPAAPGLLERIRSIFSSKEILKPRPANPFPPLKAGRKMAVVAVVEAGGVGIFRFSEGVFGDWPVAFGL